MSKLSARPCSSQVSACPLVRLSSTAMAHQHVYMHRSTALSSVCGDRQGMWYRSHQYGSGLKCKAAKGFGSSNKKATTAPEPNKYVAQELASTKQELSGPGEAKGPAVDMNTGNWLMMAELSSFPPTKNLKIVELAGGKAIIIWRRPDGKVFTTDAYSTAYKYPLIDAKILDEPTGPAVEVPLDGTVYDLATGQVLRWCPPGGNVLQSAIKSLKRNSPPIDLPVYQTIVKDGGKIWVNYQAAKPATA